MEIEGQGERIKRMKERGHFLLSTQYFSWVLHSSCCFLPQPAPPLPLCISSSLFFSLLIRPLDCSKLLSASPWEDWGGGAWESVLIKI